MDLDFVSVHKHAKKELGQYPAILTSHLVNNPYIVNCNFAGLSNIVRYNGVFAIAGCIINRTLLGPLEIQQFSSRVENDCTRLPR